MDEILVEEKDDITLIKIRLAFDDGSQSMISMIDIIRHHDVMIIRNRNK